ncbi:hypothetical protein LNP24_17205 [Klebsiella pneumoniae subsp. pneumoniae]|nr:hypothetical protein [Klebsiella pneumoniae subsp. pneumoniae]
MRISMNRELETLETHIPFLGTVGSIQPVYRSVRYRLGDYARLYRPWRGEAGHPCRWWRQVSPKR